eukprot:GHVU01047530.1.p2 GENE.GHVU01047530.1~~GHVU01047530.1.p2  ORF type:complete len:110 (-),score=0.89 GHVU01047530.1:88-417(-)
MPIVVDRFSAGLLRELHHSLLVHLLHWSSGFRPAFPGNDPADFLLRIEFLLKPVPPLETLPLQLAFVLTCYFYSQTYYSIYLSFAVATFVGAGNTQHHTIPVLLLTDEG